MPPLRSRRSVLTLNAGPPPPGGHPECPSTFVDAALYADLKAASESVVRDYCRELVRRLAFGAAGAGVVTGCRSG